MKRKLRLIRKLKNGLFFAVLLALAAVGAAWPWRPEVSELEKRELTRLPPLTLQGLLDGSFGEQAALWYADTYPLREAMIGGARRLQRLYGDRSERLILKDDTPAESIPDPTATLPPATRPSDPLPSDPLPSAAPPSDSADRPGEETLPPGPVDESGETLGSIYVSGGSAYGLYYFTRAGTERYAALVDQVARSLEGVRVCSLIVPLSSGVVLDDGLQRSIGVSDQRAAIEYTNSLMGPEVRALNVFDALRRHAGEYLYFRTDHHWTALGAYYAYEELCGALGMEAHGLDFFQTREYPGFLGSFYAETLSERMKADPDTVTAYVPRGTNQMTYVDRKGTEVRWNVIHNVDGYAAGGKYYCFAGSDQPMAWVHNPEIHDGSACLVIKDSFGNAFVPFLVDHYEYVYWIDFRYYGGTIQDLVREKGIGDVIFCLNIYNTTSVNAVRGIEKLSKKAVGLFPTKEACEKMVQN